MQAANLNLYRGDDADVNLFVSQPDGSSYNLSGCSLTFTARQNTSESAVILTKLATGTYSGVITGLSTLSFVPSDTSGLGDQPYYYDIKLFSTGQKLTTLVYGQFSIYPK